MDFGRLKPCNPVSFGLYHRTVAHITQRDPDTFIETQESYEEDFAYVLSLSEDRLPHDLRKGWLAGSGSRVTELGPLKVDFILADRTSRQKVIAPIHLILRFSPESGALLIKPASEDDPVELWDGVQFKELPFGFERAVTSNITKLRLGRRAEYDLLLTIPSDALDEYLFQLHAVYQTRTGQFIRQPVDFTPSGETRVFERVGVCVTGRTLAAGAEGWVSQGYSMRGSPLAVKIFRLKASRDKKRIENEYRIASQFGKSSILNGALQLWCEHDRDLEDQICPACHDKNYRHVEWFMSSALAQDSLDDAVSRRTLVARGHILRELFYQTLQAAEAIQFAGYIHRDISLRNILVTSREPLTLSLTDFGKAINHRHGDVHTETTLGPVPLVAPEVWSGTGYGETIEIWSAAISFTRLLVSLPWDSGRVTQNGLSQLHDRLSALERESPEDAGVIKLFCSILQWNVSDRITLQAALEHECFEGLERITTIGGHKRQKLQPVNGDEASLAPGLTQSSGDGLVTVPFSEETTVLAQQARQSSGDGIVTQPFSDVTAELVLQAQQRSGDGIVTQPFSDATAELVLQAQQRSGDGISTQPFSKGMQPSDVVRESEGAQNASEKPEESPLGAYKSEAV